MTAQNQLIYRPEELPPPSGESVGLVERIRERVSPGAGLLLDSLMRATGGELAVAVRATQGWVYCRFVELWSERNPGLAPGTNQPSYATFRRALAELCSAALVRTVQKRRRAELWLLAPVSAPPEEQLALPFARDDRNDSPADARDDSAAGARLRLYTPEDAEDADDRHDRDDELSPPVGDPVDGVGARARDRGPGLRGRGYAGGSGTPPTDRGLAGASRSSFDAHHGAGWCASGAQRGAESATAAGERGEPRLERPLATAVPSPRLPASASADPAPLVSGVSSAPQTSTSLSSLHTQKTFTSARPSNREPTSLGEVIQSRLDLEPDRDKPPPIELSPEQCDQVARQAVDLAGKLRTLDGRIDLGPIVKLCAAVVAERVERDEAVATFRQAQARKTAGGVRIGQPGRWLVKAWQALFAEAGLDWRAALPPPVKAAASRAAKAAGLDWMPRLRPKGVPP